MARNRRLATTEAPAPAGYTANLEAEVLGAVHLHGRGGSALLGVSHG